MTLPFQGAVGLVLGPAVAALNLQASRGSKYLLIVARNEASHIRHATVANFYSIPVEVSVELGSLGKVPVQHGRELLGNVGANLVVPWRVEPDHISLPGPLLSCRLLDVLELVVVSCFLQCTLVCRSLFSKTFLFADSSDMRLPII